MAGYVDGFVIPVPKKNVEAYRKIAAKAGTVWMEHGALQYIEAVGEDLKSTFGKPFPKIARAKSNETVVFSWIVYRSRAHRDKVNAKVMKDPRMAKMMTLMKEKPPFDGNRMSFGGFKIIVKK